MDLPTVLSSKINVFYKLIYKAYMLPLAKVISH